MPIRNPFARRPAALAHDENQQEPGSAASETSPADAAHPGFERVDTVREGGHGWVQSLVGIQHPQQRQEKPGHGRVQDERYVHTFGPGRRPTLGRAVSDGCLGDPASLHLPFPPHHHQTSKAGEQASHQPTNRGRPIDWWWRFGMRHGAIEKMHSLGVRG
jgi:hypothetical protein